MTLVGGSRLLGFRSRRRIVSFLFFLPFGFWRTCGLSRFLRRRGGGKPLLGRVVWWCMTVVENASLFVEDVGLGGEVC